MDDVLYIANWWTSGSDPTSNNGVTGTGRPWTIVPTSGSSTSSGSGTSGGSTAGGSGSDPSSSTTVSAYSTTADYTTGQEVTENGVTYVANWWISGTDPAANNGVTGTGQPWTLVSTGTSGTTGSSGTGASSGGSGTSSTTGGGSGSTTGGSGGSSGSTGTTSGSGNIPAYSASAIYTAGAEVQQNGLIYKAQWWTQGADPTANSGAASSGLVWLVAGKTNTTPTAPGAPTDLTATAVSSSQVDLYWSASTVAGSGTVSGYDIYQNGTLVGTTSNTYFDVTGLSAASIYKLTVDAVDATGASPQSAAAAATTLATGTVAATATFAPYIDISLYGTSSLVQVAQASGVTNFTLAFIQSSGTDQIGWAGTGTISSDTLPNGVTIQSEVQALQQMGGSVTISFGGAAGIDPAVAAVTNHQGASALQAEYQSVINRYGVTSLDFDIEGAAETNTAANALRDAAIKGLEAANPRLTISYTLPVLPTGLDNNGLAVIQQAVKDGVHIDVINIMAMDYGASVDNGGAMGTDAILAIQATEKQLTTSGLDAKIGVTPMIGVNDVSSEVFSLSDAQNLANYVASDPRVARVSMWSMSRDNGSTAGASYASPTSSGVLQSNYAYSMILNHA